MQEFFRHEEERELSDQRKTLKFKQNKFLKLRPVLYIVVTLHNTKHNKNMLKVTTEKCQIILKGMTVILSANLSATQGYRRHWKTSSKY